MKKINKLTLRNFKFFNGKVELKFDRKNILIYGENGSGKSTIYWALYTFLQSVFKANDAQIRKYFEPRNDKNLVNRYANVGSPSSIKLELKDENGLKFTNEISNTLIDARTDNVILETALGSDFMDYKILSKIYSYYHGEDIDLFEFFRHHIFPFINFQNVLIKFGQTTGSKNAAVAWDYIQSGLNPRPKMTDRIYKEFEKFIKKFNVELESYLRIIEYKTNELLKDDFKEKFKIIIKYVNANYNAFKDGTKSRNWKLIPPQILLTIELTDTLITDPYKKTVLHPQSFLNEAKLSLLSLSMRLAILNEKYVPQFTRILVLDDILLSMDLCNRDFILEIILKKYSNDFQILFFTHQRGLFDDARKFIQSFHAEIKRRAGITNQELLNKAWEDEWKIFEMYEAEIDDKKPVSVIQPYNSYLGKALYYLKEKIDYSACGNNLRNALEGYFREFLPENSLRDAHGNPVDATGLMLNDLLVRARLYFNLIGFDTSLLDKLDRYRTRSMNSASHYNPKADYYKKELTEIVSILEDLKKNKNQPIIKKNELIKFSVGTQGGITFGYTVRLLDDICLYIKNDGIVSFYNDADKRTYVVIEITETNQQPTAPNYNMNNMTLLELYNSVMPYINRNHLAIVQSDMYTVFTDVNGQTLEQLKIY